MIEIVDERFGYWPNKSHGWILADEPTMVVLYCLEQLYAQMMGWA